MKTHRIALLVILFCFGAATVALADDTQIYGSSSTLIKPNVLILFDNSGSMNSGTATTPDPYDPLTDYSAYGSKTKDAVYRKSGGGGGGGWSKYINNVSSVGCSAAYTSLTTGGNWTGKMQSNGNCGGSNRVFTMGNYLNYLNGPGSTSQPKLTIAKEVITNILENTTGVKFGVIVFNSNSEGGHILTSIEDIDVGTNRADLISDIDGLVADTNTPLAETLYEADLYFKGEASYFNPGVTYTTPIEYSCQKNYVIIMTDGDPTSDVNAILGTAVGDRDGDGNDPGNPSDWLDDVAKMMYDDDLLDSAHVSGSGKQNVLTYTIGFNVNNQLLKDTAENGKGIYYTADNAQELTQAFLGVLGSILEDDTSFVAPVVPVSPENKTYSGNFVYVGLFRPKTDSFWSGNLKKYKIEDGEIVDKNGVPVTNPDGSFIETSTSYWSTSPDGGKVEKGGVGELLLNRATPRNLYTYLPSQATVTLNSSVNAFSLANALITPTELGLAPADTTERDKLVKFIHGEDSYIGSTNNRDWIMGDVLHAGPAVIHYSNTRSVIYVGANDGMLHAFEDSTGEELWGYIPYGQLAFLENLTGTLHAYSIDGSPKPYVLDYDNSGVIGDNAGDKAILIFGERRGGTAYHAIDVTDPDNPKFLWDISSSDPGFGELGLTWSNPSISKVKISGADKIVFFVGGGYDSANEDAEPATTDTMGRAVYAIDVLTGAKVWEYSYSTDTTMTYSLASDVTAIDIDGNNYIDRLYVGDVGGRMWRFDVGDGSVANWDGTILFDSNGGYSTHRKILYPPDVVQELDPFTSNVFEYLYFGTGDRAHPLSATEVDRIYGVKDRSDPTTLPLSESNLIDVTIDLLQLSSTTQAQIDTAITDLDTEDGWYIKLDQRSGEKVVSEATVFNKVVNISTFEPTTSGGIIDPCLADVGIGRVYAVNYLTGEAVFNYDTTNDGGYDSETNKRATGHEGEVLKRSDREKTVGAGIPSAAVVVISGGGGGGGPCDVQVLVGIGGGIGTLPAECGGTIKKIFWKETYQ